MTRCPRDPGGPTVGDVLRADNFPGTTPGDLLTEEDLRCDTCGTQWAVAADGKIRAVA